MDIFWTLLVEEVREQGLLEELSQWREFSARLEAAEVSLLVLWSSDPARWYPLIEQVWKVAGDLDIERQFRSVLGQLMGKGYELRCRNALLFAFFNRLPEAEGVVSVARKSDDSKAFAHHVLGLMKGLGGDKEGARFELWLALQRETFPGARERIEKALAACG